MISYLKATYGDALFIKVVQSEDQFWTACTVRFQHPYCTIHTDFCEKEKLFSNVTKSSKDEFDNALYRAMAMISEQNKE